MFRGYWRSHFIVLCCRKAWESLVVPATRGQIIIKTMMPLARMLDVGVDARDNQVGTSGGVLAQMVGLLAPIGQGALPRVPLVNIAQTLFVFGVLLARFVLVHNQ